MSGMDSAYATATEVNMGLLLDYCRKSQPFPTESLLTNKASKDAIDFVTSTMAVDPRSRVSAAAALNSVWLRGTESRSQLLVIFFLSRIISDGSWYIVNLTLNFLARMLRPTRRRSSHR